MTATRLFLSLGVALAVLAAYNAAILRTSRSSQRQQMRTTIARLPPAADVVFLGNSLMVAGGDAVAFTAARTPADALLPSFNLALGATTPVEHSLIWRSALEHGFRPRYLVYGYFDDQLLAAAAGAWPDLVGNRAFSYYFPARAAALYAPGSAAKRWELTLTRDVPMLAERSSLWSQVERLRRNMEEIGMPKKANNRFGRVEDFGSPALNETESFNRRCNALLDERASLSPSLQEIVRLAHQYGAKIVLVEMPMPARHRAAFYGTPVWTRLRAHLQVLASEADVVCVNASDWVSDERQFEDAMHLNPEGARTFSRRLATAITALETPAAPLAAVTP